MPERRSQTKEDLEMQNLQKKNLWKQCLSIALCFTLVFSSFLLTGGAFAEEGDPTLVPAETALSTPTTEPTVEPTATDAPTTEPTATATDAPTAEPTATATDAPTAEPTATATDAPTAEPTATATDAPTATATEAPTVEPTATAAVLPKLVLQVPTMGLATVISSAQLKITWNRITNAQWYEISRSASASGPYTTIGQSTSLEFTDNSCIFGVVNYYKVRACATVDMVNVYSDWSGYRSCFGLSTPGFTNMESVDVTGVRFSWRSVANATGYYLSYSTSPNGPFTRFLNVTGGATTAVQYRITTGQKYYYRVQAYSMPGAVTYVGPLSMAMPFTRTPIKATLTAVTPLSSTSSSLTWNQVPGAVGYAVFRSNALNGSYYRVANIAGGNTLSATIGAINGSMNYYKVCGYVYYGNTQVLGTLSDALGAFPMVAPTITKAIYSSTVSAYLLWNGVSGATGYNIYRSTAAAGPYTKVADSALTWYTDTTLTNNVCYYYRVSALRLQDGTTYESPMSAIVPVTVVNATLQSYTNNADQTVTLYWIKNAGGLGGFEVSRSLYANYGYTVIKDDYIGNFTYNGTQYSYTDPSPYVGMVNYYRVRCFRYNGSAKVYSDYSNTLSTLSISTSRVSAFTTGGDGYVTLTYQAVNLATQYRIYRSTISGGTYSLVGTSTGLTFRDTGITPGTVYYYRIAAYVGGLLGPLSNPQPYVSLAQPTVDAISDTTVSHPVINWDVITGATNYRIFRSTTLTGTYSYISWISNGSTTTFTDSSVDVSTPYYYKVQPVYFVSGGINSDGLISAAKMFISLGKPTLTSCKPYNANTNYLIWTAVNGVDGYEISRSTSASGIFASIANVENATVYINSGLPAGTYYYKVRAYKTTNGYKQYGHYSDTGMARVLGTTSITGYYAYASQTDVRLGWSVVSNADGYAVYYSATNNTNYVLAGYVTDGNLKAYTVTNLQPNTTYYFKVAPYQFTDGGASRIDGTTSSEVSCVTSPRTSITSLRTPNPYTIAQNGQTWTYSIPGAYRLIITFSDDTNLYYGRGYLDILDKNSNLIGHYTGNALGGATVEVVGDSFTLKMTTDSTQARGFQVTSVVAYVN